MPPKILGLDLSYSGTGIAVWSEQGWAFETVRTHEAEALEVRWHQINDRILRHTMGSGPYLAVIEAPPPMKGPVAINMAMLHGSVRTMLFEREVPVAAPIIQHIKQFATGSGSASKDQMVAMARARLHLPIHSHDQADAAFAAAMALHRYGRPLCTTTEVQDAAVAKTNWPRWSFEAVTA